MRKDPSPQANDLFFDTAVEGYVTLNRRFVRRDWLAANLDQKLAAAGARFVLIVAEPGAGKSAFMAQLAHDHPAWPRYFIRRDQHALLADVSVKSLLLRVGYQLAARYPDLFSADELKLSVAQHVGEAAAGSEVVGVDAERLVASPFLERVLQIRQNVRQNRGRLVGLRVEELVVETRLLTVEDLLDLSVIRPARALARKDPAQRIVILIDALDEIRYHATADDILTWLTNCPELPPNVRFVLTSRGEGDALAHFRGKQAKHLRDLAIAEADQHVTDDIRRFVDKLVNERALKRLLRDVKSGPDGFVRKVMAKASGNIGYVDALARGIDSALLDMESKDGDVAAGGRRALDDLIGLDELPAQLHGLYTLFLLQIKASVARVGVEIIDSASNKTSDKPVWPTMFMPILGVLAVAEEPVDAALLYRLSGIRAEAHWFNDALDRLRQFLDVGDRRYRFYHATVAEFLTERNRGEPGDGLSVDAPAWHGRIADDYWTTCGGHWERCDAYGLRSLAAHLFKAGKIEQLYGLTVPGWMTARAMGRDGAYQEFLADLHLVGEGLKQRARDGDCPPDLLAKALRVALVRVAIHSVSGAYPPGLVAEAVRRGLWSPDRAMLVAAQIPDAPDRALMYAGLLAAGVLPAATRRDAIDQGLKALIAASGNRSTEFGRAVVALAPFLDRQDQLDALWEPVGKIGWKWIEVRAEAKAALAIRFPAGARRRKALAEALEEALDNDENYEDVPFRILAPHLTGRLLTRALAADQNTNCLIEAVGPLVPDTMLQRLVKLTEEMDPRERVAALAAFAQRLPAGKRLRAWRDVLKDTDDDDLRDVAGVVDDALLDEVLTRAIALPDEDDRGRALAVLAPRLDAKAAERALAAARDISNGALQRGIFAALAPRLRARSRGQAVADALADGEADDRHRAERIRALLPLMSADQVQAAYEAALAEPDESDGNELLAALLPRLPQDAALNCASVVDSVRDEDEFVALVERLPAQTRSALLWPLWTAAWSFRGDDRDQATRAVMPHLPDDLVRKALRDAVTIVGDRDFSSLGAAVREACGEDRDPAPADDGAPEPIPEETIAAALDEMQQRNAYDWNDVDRELAKLAPFVSGDLQRRALDLAITMFQHGHASSLVALAERLDPVHCERVLAVAIEKPHPAGDIFTSSTKKEAWVLSGQASLIAALASKLTGPQRIQALEKANQFPKDDKVVALTGLAPCLDEARRNILIEEAIVAASSPYAEWRVFASLSPVVGAERYDRVLASASALYQPDDRVRALSMLLPNAPDPVRVRSMIRRALIEHILGLEQWPSLLMSELRSRWLSELGHHEGVLAALQAHLSELQEQWVWH